MNLEDIESVHFHWSESGFLNHEFGKNDEDDIEKTVSAEVAEDAIRRASKLVTGGYDKTSLTIKMKDGKFYCREVKFYLTKRKDSLLKLICEDEEEIQ